MSFKEFKEAKTVEVSKSSEKPKPLDIARPESDTQKRKHIEVTDSTIAVGDAKKLKISTTSEIVQEGAKSSITEKVASIETTKDTIENFMKRHQDSSNFMQAFGGDATSKGFQDAIANHLDTKINKEISKFAELAEKKIDSIVKNLDKTLDAVSDRLKTLRQEFDSFTKSTQQNNENHIDKIKDEVHKIINHVENNISKSDIKELKKAYDELKKDSDTKAKGFSEENLKRLGKVDKDIQTIENITQEGNKLLTGLDRKLGDIDGPKAAKVGDLDGLKAARLASTEEMIGAAAPEALAVVGVAAAPEVLAAGAVIGGAVIADKIYQKHQQNKSHETKSKDI